MIILFLSELELICLHTIKHYFRLHIIKWFQVFQSNTNNSIQDYSFICCQLNGSNYSYVIAMISVLKAVEWFQLLLSNTDNFICTQLNSIAM